MYLCWRVRGRISRLYLSETRRLVVSFWKSAEICSETDLEISTFEGVKLNDTPDEVGVGLEQFTAQHRRAASADGDRSLVFALSQQSIIWPSVPECNGIPASTPPASAKSKNRDVTCLFTQLTIFKWSKPCQGVYSHRREFSYVQKPSTYFKANPFLNIHQAYLLDDYHLSIACLSTVQDVQSPSISKRTLTKEKFMSI